VGPDPRGRHWVLVSAEVTRCATAGGGPLLTRRFAFFALGDRRPRSMTRGPRTRVRGWSAAFSGNEEAQRSAPCVAIRLLRTQRPAPKEYDSWAWAPVPGAGPFLSTEMKRRDGSLLAWWFAFFALGDRRPRSMTRGLRSLCQGLVRCFRQRCGGAAVRSSRGVSPSSHTETDAQGV
jgi:hypothetical protein